MKSTYVFLVLIGVGVSSFAFAGAETAGSAGNPNPWAHVGLCFGDDSDDPAICLPMESQAVTTTEAPGELNVKLTACAHRLASAFLVGAKHVGSNDVPRERQVEDAVSFSLRGCQSAIREDQNHDEEILTGDDLRVIAKESAEKAFDEVYSKN